MITIKLPASIEIEVLELIPYIQIMDCKFEFSLVGTANSSDIYTIVDGEKHIV